jgi:hypothetical protein
MTGSSMTENASAVETRAKEEAMEASAIVFQGGERPKKTSAGQAGGASGAPGWASPLAEKIHQSAGVNSGQYDARRLRSQREIIRDVMLAAADCDTWLTLGELRALTRYGEASISAQLRHLRKFENGGYEVAKRHREGATTARPCADGRGECVWEYRMERGKGTRGLACSSGDGEGTARPQM